MQPGNQDDQSTKGTRKLIFLPLLPVIFFFLHNLNLFKELLLTIEAGVVFICYTSLALLLYVLMRRVFQLLPSPSAFLATLVILFFLFFGPLQDFLLFSGVLSFLGNSMLLILMFSTLLISLFILSRKRKLKFVKATRYLSIAFSVLVLTESVLYVVAMVRGETTSKITAGMKGQSPIAGDQVATGNPDIHHILFDSYTNAPALRQFWNYENDIYPYLRSKGFYTVDSGFSNYGFTPFSMASVFNLRYLDQAKPFLAPNSANFLVGNHVYRNNHLYEFLQTRQYRFSIHSILDDEDELFGLGYLAISKPDNWLRRQTLERIYLNPWILQKIKNKVSGEDEMPATVKSSINNFHDYNERAIAHLRSLCNKPVQNDSAIFSFTHLMLPHAPYTLDAAGSRLTKPHPYGADMNAYLQQLKYCNQLIREVTECLLADSNRDKIIIIQGDHGYRQHPTSAYHAKYGALNAVYIHSQNYTGLTKKMSLVNTYRIILNNEFGQSLPLLADTIVNGK